MAGRDGWPPTTNQCIYFRCCPDRNSTLPDSTPIFPFLPGSSKRCAIGRLVFQSPALTTKKCSVIQGTASGGSRIKLYFDSQTGFLLRQLRYTNTVVGTIPQQIDYSDYRDVDGVKMPFHWVVTWTDGQSTFQLNEVQPNAAIDNAKLARPPEAVVKKAAAK